MEDNELTKRERMRAHYVRGLAYLELNRYKKAVADFTTAIESFPRVNPYFLSARSVAYHRLGQTKKALADIDKAISKMPLSGFKKIRAQILSTLKRGSETPEKSQ